MGGVSTPSPKGSQLSSRDRSSADNTGDRMAHLMTKLKDKDQAVGDCG